MPEEVKITLSDKNTPESLANGDLFADIDVQYRGISIVLSPVCTVCRETLIAAGGYQWACETKGCVAAGKTVHFPGLHPNCYVDLSGGEGDK